MQNPGLFLILATLFGFLIGIGMGFFSHFIFSGLKGRGHNRGPTYMGGFGGGRGGGITGGIIISDEEPKNMLK